MFQQNGTPSGTTVIEPYIFCKNFLLYQEPYLAYEESMFGKVLKFGIRNWSTYDNEGMSVNKHSPLDKNCKI